MGYNPFRQFAIISQGPFIAVDFDKQDRSYGTRSLISLFEWMIFYQAGQKIGGEAQNITLAAIIPMIPRAHNRAF